MPLPLIIPIAAAAAPLIAKGVEAIGNNKAQKRTIAANKELAEYQYSKDLEMWNRQNQYNDPAAQMTRLKQAGLNPNMVYGSGTVAGNTGSQMPHYNAPTVEYKNPLQGATTTIPEMLSMYQNFEKMKADTDLVKSQKLKVDQETANDWIRNLILSTDYHQKGLDYDKSRDTKDYYISRQASEAESAKLRVEALKKGLPILDEKLTSEQLANEIRRAEILFRKYENQWRAMGVTSSDAPLMRFITRFLGESDIDFKEVWKSIHNF